MYTSRIRQRFTAVMGALIVLSLLAIPATATHSWGGFHWARTSNPFTLKVGDNVDSRWDTHLDNAILVTSPYAWSQSTVLDLTKVSGAAKSVKSCKPTPGQIEVCNAAYGYKTWSGLAQVWVS